MSHQLSLGVSVPVLGDFTSDDWETPLPLAKFFVDRVDRIVREKLGSSTVLKVLEVGAGRGNITQFTADKKWDVLAVEPKYSRLLHGSTQAAPHATWVNARLEDLEINEPFDVIFSNPPFSETAFSLIFPCLKKISHPSTVFAFILPTTFWQTVWASRLFLDSDLQIVKRIEIINRVAFLKDGVAVPGRQCYDAIHILQSNTGDPAIEVVKL